MSSTVEICQLAYEGNFNKLKLKILEDKSLATKSDDSGRTALHWATSAGHTDIVDFMLSLHVPIDQRDAANWTPLMIAVSAGRTAIVTNLMTKDAQVNAVNSTGQCALHYAASKDRFEIAQKLLEDGACPTIADHLGSTPLHRSSSLGHLNMTKLLVSYINICPEAGDTVIKDNAGNTPLHLACEENRTAVAKLLVESGFNLDVWNQEEKTPLDLAPPGLARELTTVAVHPPGRRMEVLF